MDQLTAVARINFGSSTSLKLIPSDKTVDNHVDSSEYAKRLGPRLRPIITSFFADIGYDTPPKVKNDALWEAMLLRARETGVSLASIQSQTCFEVGFTYAAICYPDHPLVAQVYTGIHTWLGTQIDDAELKDEVEKFPERFFAGERQPNLVLQGYADILRSTHVTWDVVTANFIVLSSLEFINCNVLEDRAEFQTMTPTGGGRRWPHYFRDREGVPEAYSYSTFPKEKYPEISMFLEAIPDMGRVLNLANDVLSFYKEERAGVKKNYIHLKANYESRDVVAVLESAAKECIEAAKRIEVVLDGREPYKQAWLSHLHGYIHMHRITNRYKLYEIGLAEEKRCVVLSLEKSLETLVDA
ncbi:hypothetical protein VMCG_07951 [Cytospora schulzeri]|uniref:Terpene synthase n=1 Tax=Cytospora schulzeri TaxID=448051 RepID=A0A423VY51_9PEZI|nr:hypothetical protein VMCG_07951 [Valsa malicola]